MQVIQKTGLHCPDCKTEVLVKSDLLSAMFLPITITEARKRQLVVDCPACKNQFHPSKR